MRIALYLLCLVAFAGLAVAQDEHSERFFVLSAGGVATVVDPASESQAPILISHDKEHPPEECPDGAYWAFVPEKSTNYHLLSALQSSNSKLISCKDDQAFDLVETNVALPGAVVSYRLVPEGGEEG